MQGDGLTIGGSTMDGMEAFVIDSNDALKFRLLKNASDADIADPDDEFEPVMSHQIYGENENIFGYRDLKISFWMCGSTLKSFIGFDFAEKLTKEQTGGVDTDPVLEPLAQIMAEGQLVESKEELSAHMRSEKVTKFKPLGTKVEMFSLEKSNETFEIYSADDTVTGFRDYHSKLQPWIMFYIDAASYIDIDDPNWRFFLIFQKYSVDGETRYCIAGYATIYQYYAYPANTRPRISQVLILPPFQRKGLGSKLLNTIYRQYLKDDKVVDITVEDPSEEFVRLRDFVDAQNCLEQVKSMGCMEAVSKGFTDAMATEANQKLKLCKRQARRVYEILRLHFVRKAGGLTDKNAGYKDFRIDVKKRLNMPFQTEERKLAKLKKALSPEEFAAATLNLTNKEQRLESLQSQYKELEDHYLHTLERISSAC